MASGSVTDAKYSRHTVVRLKDCPDNVSALIGRLVYVVRQSKRTGGLTVAFVDAGAGYDKDETIHVAPYQVERVMETR
jgi:hypothetical protein